MAGTEDRIKGKANEAIGTARERAGEAMDNHEMEAEGKLQQVKGKAQGALGEAKDRLSGDDRDEDRA